MPPLGGVLILARAVVEQSGLSGSSVPRRTTHGRSARPQATLGISPLPNDPGWRSSAISTNSERGSFVFQPGNHPAHGKCPSVEGAWRCSRLPVVVAAVVSHCTRLTAGKLALDRRVTLPPEDRNGPSAPAKPRAPTTQSWASDDVHLVPFCCRCTVYRQHTGCPHPPWLRHRMMSSPLVAAALARSWPGNPAGGAVDSVCLVLGRSRAPRQGGTSASRAARALLAAAGNRAVTAGRCTAITHRDAPAGHSAAGARTDRFWAAYGRPGVRRPKCGKPGGVAGTAVARHLARLGSAELASGPAPRHDPKHRCPAPLTALPQRRHAVKVTTSSRALMGCNQSWCGIPPRLGEDCAQWVLIRAGREHGDFVACPQHGAGVDGH